MADDIERRMAAERAVARRVVSDLIAAGYSLDLDDGGDELVVRRSVDVDEVCAAMHTVDEEMLVARGNTTGKRGGVVNFVYGNDGWDAVNDYSVTLDAVIDPINRWCDEQEDSERRSLAAASPDLWQWLVTAIDPSTGDNADLVVTARNADEAAALWRAYYDVDEDAEAIPHKVFRLPHKANRPVAHAWHTDVVQVSPSASAA